MLITLLIIGSKVGQGFLYLLEFRPGNIADQVPGSDVLRLVGLELDHTGVGALLEVLVLIKKFSNKTALLVL